jgi:hypothetical protein
MPVHLECRVRSDLSEVAKMTFEINFEAQQRLGVIENLERSSKAMSLSWSRVELISDFIAPTLS